MGAIDNFDELNALVEKLIHLHKASKLKIESLTAENYELRRKFTNWDNELKAKQRELSASELATDLKSQGLNTLELKSQIAGYIEAIDQCLKTMNG